MLLVSAPSIYAGDVILSNVLPGGAYQIPVKSFVELRFKTVYKQRYDFSCGSAALASLLAFHYDDKVDEQSVFKDMYAAGDKRKIHKQGFSLLDMKRYLDQRGYRSNGFKISLDQLIKAEVPAITIINNNGYFHFIIIKGLNEQEVLVGDPAVGVKVIARDEFEKMWGNRILFLIQDKKLLTNELNSSSEWSARIKAPLGLAIDRTSLSAFNVLLLGNSDF
jgi:predicted double-glycine peptidase